MLEISILSERPKTPGADRSRGPRYNDRLSVKTPATPWFFSVFQIFHNITAPGRGIDLHRQKSPAQVGVYPFRENQKSIPRKPKTENGRANMEKYRWLLNKYAEKSTDYAKVTEEKGIENPYRTNICWKKYQKSPRKHFLCQEVENRDKWINMQKKRTFRDIRDVLLE